MVGLPGEHPASGVALQKRSTVLSPAVISNLMALGDFRPSDAVKGFSWAVAAAIRFENPNKTRRLTILPAEGWVEYDNQEVRTGLKGPIEEVPDEAQAFRLGLLYLHKVGVDRSQLATKYGSSDLLVFATKRERGRVASTHRAGSPEVLSRGVSFVRRSDGAAFTGTGPAGGFSVEFGNHARVAHLELVWRNLEPWQSCPVDSAQIVQNIRKGRAVKTSPPALVPAEITKLEVLRLNLLYQGKLGEERQEFVHAFADLEVRAEFRHTNATFHLSCPLSAD